jgi:aspartate-semialdehyde dehydrogenase
LNDETIQGFDLAIFSAGGATSGEWAPRFVDAGAVVVDNSSKWRRDPEVPLVVAEVNPDALEDHKGLIANPNCSTMQLMVALKPIHDAAGLERLIVSTYQSTSGTGVRAVAELEEQTRAALAGEDLPAPQVYPHPIAFNVLGGAGNFAAGDDHTDEERKMMFETRKILADESIAINVTCARVPVRNCHSESVTLQTREALSVQDARELLERAPGLSLVDDPATHGYPTALGAAGRDEVFAGRLRRDPSHERGLCLWVVSDNLLKGAATNAVQIAEVLHQRGVVGARPVQAA